MKIGTNVQLSETGSLLLTRPEGATNLHVGKNCVPWRKHTHAQEEYSNSQDKRLKSGYVDF